MNGEAERNLRNLSVIALLRQNDKLMTLSDTFVISPPTTYRGLMRKWSGETRDANLVRIHETVNAAFSFIMNAKEEIKTVQDGIQKRRTLFALQRMIEALCQSRMGLSNLNDTYSDDSTAQVRLRLIVQEITDLIQIFQSDPQVELLNDDSNKPSPIARTSS